MIETYLKAMDAKVAARKSADDVLDTRSIERLNAFSDLVNKAVDLKNKVINLMNYNI